jgi:hypothetical protein
VGNPISLSLFPLFRSSMALLTRLPDDVARFAIRDSSAFIARLDAKERTPQNGRDLFGKFVQARATLYLFYPNRPPSYYTQRGYVPSLPAFKTLGVGDQKPLTVSRIEISEEGIMFGQIKGPIDPHVVAMQTKALFPIPVIKAILDFTGAAGASLFRQAFQRDPPTQPPEYRGNTPATPSADAAHSRNYGPGTTSRKPAAPSDRRGNEGTGSSASSPSSSQPPQQSAEKKDGTLSPSDDDDGSARDKPSSLGSLMAVPMTRLQNLDRPAFEKLVEGTQLFVRREPTFGPYGGVRVTGVLRMIFEHGTVLVDVDCYWDPRAEAVDGSSYRSYYRVAAGRRRSA